MPLDASKYQEHKSPELPHLNRPKPNPDIYQAASLEAMNRAIALRAQETANSLQALDQRLNQFEDRFADAAVDRIDSVALRIEAKIAARLQQRQEQRQKLQIIDVLDAFTIPELEYPALPHPCAGALPI